MAMRFFNFIPGPYERSLYQGGRGGLNPFANPLVLRTSISSPSKDVKTSSQNNILGKVLCGTYFAECTLWKILCAKVLCGKYFAESNLRKVRDTSVKVRDTSVKDISSW